MVVNKAQIIGFVSGRLENIVVKRENVYHFLHLHIYFQELCSQDC